jgi:serine/threonine protein kinase
MTMVRLRRQDPRIVGSYRLLRRLGAGGMGVVYLGVDRHGKKVALKLIRQELAGNPEFRSRFAREVAAAAMVRGNRTAPLVDADPDAERPWLATEYVPGPSLQRRVGDRGPLGCLDLARVGSAVADGLVSVHAVGVVHRDVKPSNILLSPDGPQIIDFGIAYADGAGTLTVTGTAVGSPGFLAPEQVRGQTVTPATDIFALGVTLAYAGRGAPPFGSGPVDALLYRVVHEEPDLEGVPEQVAPLIAACLSKDPRMRPSAEQVRERLAVIARQREAERGTPARGLEFAQPTTPGPGPKGAGAGRPDSDPAAPTPRDRDRDRERERERERARRESARREAPRRDEDTRTAPRPDPGRHHPSRPESGRPDMDRHDSGRHDTVRHDPGRHDPSRSDSGRHDVDRADAVRPEPPRGFVPERGEPGRAGRADHGPRSRAGTAAPRRRRPEDRRRLLILQFVIFIVVTVLAALAIAAFQDDDKDPGPDKTSAAAGPVAPQRAGVGTRIGPATGSVPVVDWADRTYSDPSAGGAGFTLTDGAADVGSDRVTLGEVVPANLDGEPAVVVVLTRAPGAGGLPTHLVELFTFTPGNAGPVPAPVGVAAVAVPADPQAVATRWTVGDDAILRIRSYVDSPDVTTRYLPGPAGVLVPVGP